MYSGYVRLITVYLIILTIPICNFQDTRIPKHWGKKFISHRKMSNQNFRNPHRNLYNTNSNNDKFDTTSTKKSELDEYQPIIVKHFHFPSKISIQHKQVRKLRKRSEDDDKDKENTDEEDDNETSKSKPDNTALFEEIREDLDEIKANTPVCDEDKKCNLEGFWISDAIGKTFGVKYARVNATMKTKDACEDSLDTNIVTVKPSVQPLNTTNNVTVKFINFPKVPLKTQNEHLVFNKSWHFRVDVPFKGVGVLVLEAKYEPGKLVAVFIGQCHLCENHEAIFGQWMVSYLATDCQHLQVCQTVHGDVLRRNTTVVPLKKGDT